MKICWDNLNKLVYKKTSGCWVNKTGVRFYFREKCLNCGESCLVRKNDKGFCSIKCSQSKKFNNFYGKKRPGHSKRMSGKNNPMYGKRFFGSDNPNYGKGDKIRGSKCYKWNGGYQSRGLPTYTTFAPQLCWCENVRYNNIDKNIMEVKCAYCGKWYVPKLSDVERRIQSIKGNLTGEQRFYCSDGCKQSCPIFRQRRYPKGFKPATSREVQPQLRQMVFERDNYTCQKCGETNAALHCHHIDPVAQNPIESADLDNCITLCKGCHLYIHKIDWCVPYKLKCIDGG